MTNPAQLSVLVPCFNNEAYIEDCLRSVRWADEVVVCDSFSTDSTVDIARGLADRVVQHEYVNSAQQKNWAIPQVSHDWVLIVDTDEGVTAELRREIEDALAHPDGFSGYRMPRANFVFGRHLRHGGYWPDFQIRLFRKDAGRYEDRQVHARVLLDGPCGTLTAPLVHRPHRSLDSFRSVMLSRYTTWEARQKFNQGVRFRPHQLIVRPMGVVARRFLWERGFLDGWQGALMCAVWMCYVFITYRKLRAMGNE